MSFESFSDRIRTTIPSLARDPDAPAIAEAAFLVVKNQLLVCEQGMAAFNEWRKMNTDWQCTRLTSLFDGLSPKVGKIEDVEIWQVDAPPSGGTIFEVTTDIRANYLGKKPKGSVSPNHVLVPAGPGYACPHGAPKPFTGSNPELPVFAEPSVKVTVIDSGFGDLPSNPLDPWPLTTVTAERLPTAAEAAFATSWIQPLPEPPVEVVPGTADTLVALAGHANFVAGVVARKCPHAQIKIHNHDAAFLPNSPTISTEATVARSLCQSLADDPQVINLGFAFLPFKNVSSCIWKSALQFIGTAPVGRAKATGPIVVCPAGNQGSSVPRYPAALGKSLAHPNGFERVIGVASIDKGGDKLSKWKHNGIWEVWSNHGSWVACSAYGSGVASTFLSVDMPLEDAETANSFNFANSWATWNGTSFAAPKVTAAIALRLANPAAGVDSLAAWNGLVASSPTPGQPRPRPNDRGYLLPDLD